MLEALHIFRNAILVSAVGLALFGAAAAQENPPDSRFGFRIAQAVSVGDKLFALNSSGLLAKVDLNSGQYEFVSEATSAIAKDGHRLWLLRRIDHGGDEDRSVIERISPGEPTVRYSTPFLHDASRDGRINLNELAVAFLVDGGRPVLMEGRAVHRLDDSGNWNTVTLSAPIHRPIGASSPAIAMTRDGSTIYVGLNAGEWGGGLVRVDVATGDVQQIQQIEQDDPQDICAGPLNTACDPVTAVTPDPENSSCVLASVGLSHMMSHGRVLRVCDGDVQTIFRRLIISEEDDFYSLENAERFDLTEPVYGLSSGELGVFALTRTGLYRIGDDEPIQLSNFETLGPLRVTRSVPGYMVVLTDINWAVSLSGYTPMLVELDQE